jgi:hypothetical protein
MHFVNHFGGECVESVGSVERYPAYAFFLLYYEEFVMFRLTHSCDTLTIELESHRSSRPVACISGLSKESSESSDPAGFERRSGSYQPSEVQA